MRRPQLWYAKPEYPTFLGLDQRAAERLFELVKLIAFENILCDALVI